MKKLLLLTFSVCSLCCYGQHTLTVDANSPRPGDEFTTQRVETFSPGLSGEDILWDFSFIEPIEDYSKEYFLDLDSITVVGLDPDLMSRYVIVNDSLKNIGYENAQTFMSYKRPLVLLTYPFAYGDSISTRYRGDGMYCSVNGIHTRGIISVDADAYGSVILSSEDTIQNVLRVHILKSGSYNMNILSDTTAFDPNNLKQEIEERYQWYARGYRYPIFETVTTSFYNNTEPVSCLQKAFCNLPDNQRLLRDSLNADILYNDSINNGRHNSGDSDIIDYNIETNGNNISITYDLKEKATISTLLCNQMGFVYRRSSVTQDAGEGYSLNMDCTGLRRGVYILYINVNGKIYNEKVNLK